MKTLIYVLATPKSGTTKLAHALRSIGIDAHHEVLPTTDIYLGWMKKRFTSTPEVRI